MQMCENYDKTAWCVYKQLMERQEQTRWCVGESLKSLNHKAEVRCYASMSVISTTGEVL